VVTKGLKDVGQRKFRLGFGSLKRIQPGDFHSFICLFNPNPHAKLLTAMPANYLPNVSYKCNNAKLPIRRINLVPGR
jgi:hypothetical protein